MEQTNRLGTLGVGKLLLKLSVPAVTAQLVNMLYNIVDRIYIGNMEGIGDAALTGVGVTFPVLMFISAFASLIGMGERPEPRLSWEKRITPRPSALWVIAWQPF